MHVQKSKTSAGGFARLQPTFMCIVLAIGEIYKGFFNFHPLILLSLVSPIYFYKAYAAVVQKFFP